MTRREKAKLFGRLTEAEQREIVHEAHQAADAQQAEIHIYVRVAHSGPIGADGFALVRLAGGTDDWTPPVNWYNVRTVKPRPVQNSDIRSVMHADIHRLRGNH